MQVWASKGYFVFFCNIHGSDGRGNEFMDIRGKYGTIDYDELMQFTDKVLETYPQIDSSRVGVTGGSYGGFMTNWIIGHTDRFACALLVKEVLPTGSHSLRQVILDHTLHKINNLLHMMKIQKNCGGIHH